MLTAATFPRPSPAHAQSQATNPHASVWVAASAGSGKTKILVDRVLSLLLQNIPPERILCLTFTKAAAAEVANRIHQKLLQWATLPESVLDKDLAYLRGNTADAATLARARRLFAYVLDVGIHIETLHAFCQSLLRRFPLESGVVPYFRVMDEHESAEAMTAAWEKTLLTAYNERDSARAVALETVTALVHETHFPELMDELVTARSRLQRLLALHNGVDGIVAAVRAKLGLALDETALSLLSAACTDEACNVPALQMAVTALQEGSKTDIERGKILAAWLAEPAHRMKTFDDYLKVFFTEKGTVRQILITQDGIRKTPGAASVLAAESERLVGVQKRRKAAAVAEATAALLRLGADFLQAYLQYKNTRALLDYDDLILTTSRLLESEGQSAWVLYKLDGGLDHLLIDEAQDVSAEQWLIVERLTREFFSGLGSREGKQTDLIRTVFAVGDRKQSIYSFQGAAPDSFESMQSLLREKVRAVGQVWADVPLHISFRSTPAVLQAVDAVFQRDPARNGVALVGETIGHISFRAGQAGFVEVWPLMKMEEQGPLVQVRPWEGPVTPLQQDGPMTNLARLIARRIAVMIEKRDWLESRQRPVQASDIMVLVRRRSGFIEDFVHALKGLKIPVTGVDRMILSEQIAVMDLTALGHVLLLPEDDLTLAAVLKSPLISLTEEQLFALAYPRGSRTLWQALQEHAGAATPFGYACDWLTRLLALADSRRPYELYTHVLGSLGGRRRLIARLGPDAEEIIDEFLALTLRYEASHVPSLQGFLQWLKTTRVEAKRDLEQTREEAVRVMTVHGAKGLQSPIVFLPDTVQVPTQIPRLLWEDGQDGLVFWQPKQALETDVCLAIKSNVIKSRDREYNRLLYVAMTRAEDRLYVCGWRTHQGPPVTCWYQLIHTALAPIGKRAVDTTLAESGLLPSAEVLRLETPQENEKRYIVEKKISKPASQLALPPWAVTPPPMEPPHPLVPSHFIKYQHTNESPLKKNMTRAYYYRGNLIHRLLQILPQIPPTERFFAAKHYLEHTDLRPAARIALISEVLAVLTHPALVPLFGPGSQAEVSVVGHTGKRVVSGKIDRLVVMEDSVIIADYKTHKVVPQSVEDIPVVYLQQMAAYRSVLTALYPSRRVDCVLVWTEGPLVTQVPEVILTSLLEE